MGWLTRVLNKIAGSFQPAADRVQAMDFSPRVKTLLQRMAEGLPKTISTAVLTYLEKVLAKEKDREVKDMTVLELVAMFRNVFKF